MKQTSVQPFGASADRVSVLIVGDRIIDCPEKTAKVNERIIYAKGHWYHGMVMDLVKEQDKITITGMREAWQQESMEQTCGNLWNHWTQTKIVPEDPSTTSRDSRHIVHEHLSTTSSDSESESEYLLH